MAVDLVLHIRAYEAEHPGTLRLCFPAEQWLLLLPPHPGNHPFRLCLCVSDPCLLHAKGTLQYLPSDWHVSFRARCSKSRKLLYMVAWCKHVCATGKREPTLGKIPPPTCGQHLRSRLLYTEVRTLHGGESRFSPLLRRLRRLRSRC